MCLGIPAEVLNVFSEGDVRWGNVSFSGLRKNIDLSFVPDVQIGDFVLCHVGIAISVIDQAEAHRTLETLKALGELDPQTEGEVGE